MVSDKSEALNALADQLGLNRHELEKVAVFTHFSEAEVRELMKLLRLRLNALVGNDRENMAHWMRTYNSGLGAMPLELIRTPEGVRAVLNYLDFFVTR
ncbi:Protein of unknown function [Marinobacter sp. DSM 26671]|jgi:hypothetical protein|uniref:MbcA/ParS/Xre antitoxin family protein n=1 Tax=Marinobacter sp. DSM 26671 TaxID=1761793 RepID=UPI0008F434B7|nr:MbcA/ParS/Xre antitoxin family protein [Marinobacter sp. DSM 26671]SFE93348.1 Protein of unknown function [Marinobacter sp. DSM 26671]|tara:strand:- start:1707 stop:2000 length:294 start_codon:yes stop_codon:yes gene_type:complete